MNRQFALSARLKSLFSSGRQVAIVVSALAALCFLTLLTTWLSRPATHSSKSPPQFESFQTEPSASLTDPIAGAQRLKQIQENDAPSAPVDSSAPATRMFAEPRREQSIAFSADLGVITKDFLHARSSLEEILDRHHGYAARLRMVGHPAGSSLSATLKVPASEYSSALADLKSIGDVQQDEEAADEVVQQRGDIDARLQNARNNERRLQELLKNNSDKSIDVDYVRRQLIALHAEIVRLELQRHSYDDRVVFSSIRFSLREVRETPAETVSAQIRHAAASGLTDLVATLSAFLVFLVGYGPSFLLWAAIIFFPARYLWRRTRLPLARETA
jgi:hypothetical protein